MCILGMQAEDMRGRNVSDDDVYERYYYEIGQKICLILHNEQLSQQSSRRPSGQGCQHRRG